MNNGNPMFAYTEGAGMARNLAHRCRREGEVSEFRRHMQRALRYLQTAKMIRDIRRSNGYA